MKISVKSLADAIDEKTHARAIISFTQAKEVNAPRWLQALTILLVKQSAKNPEAKSIVADVNGLNLVISLDPNQFTDL